MQIQQKLAQMASEPKYIRSNMRQAWTPETVKSKNPNIFCEPGKISQNCSRVLSNLCGDS